MKIIFLTLGTIFVIMITSALLLYIFYGRDFEQPAEQLPTPIQLPIGEPITPIQDHPTTQVQRTMSLTDQNGNPIVVNDFINNGITIQDMANPGRYLLAGNLGYCLANPEECQAGEARSYNIYFDSEMQSFVMVIIEEPIGEIRHEMEQLLLSTLGITEMQLCSLNYYVGVTSELNEQFAGKNLGFSFCPGAVVLPM